MSKPLLIIVDDEPEMADLVKDVGELAGFDILIANNAKDFQTIWTNNTPSVIVMDLVMPDMDGVELLYWLGERKCDTPIILISGYGEGYLEMADHMGSGKGDQIVGTLKKPFQLAELEAMLNMAVAGQTLSTPH